MGSIDWGNIKYSNFLFMLSYHLLMFAFVPFYFYFYGFPPVSIWISFIALYFLIGISITMGYHRLYSHKSYSTIWPIEAGLLFFGTLAAQNSALKWSYAHRIHHAKVDTDEDPYSIKKGFWYAHLLWIFERSKKSNYSKVPDLMKNSLVRLQDKYYLPIYLLGNIAIIIGFGYFLGDYLASFVFLYLFRTFAIHHSTFFINSLAHMWGTKPYSKENSPVDNWFISLVSFGEGYHNYHHTYASDYRNGVKWYSWDPTKWIVWTLDKIGLAKINSLPKRGKEYL